ARALERFGLQAAGDRRLRAKDRPVDRHADERDDFRLPAPHFSPERAKAERVLVRPQRVDSRRRARHDVGDPESPLGQPIVVFSPDRLRHEPRFVQELPETIRIAGEMMADFGGSHAGIDAHEQDADAGTNAVLQDRKGLDAYPAFSAFATIRGDSASDTGITDKREVRTSGEALNAVSAVVAASVTGRRSL